MAESKGPPQPETSRFRISARMYEQALADHRALKAALRNNTNKVAGLASKIAGYLPSLIKKLGNKQCNGNAKQSESAERELRKCRKIQKTLNRGQLAVVEKDILGLKKQLEVKREEGRTARERMKMEKKELREALKLKEELKDSLGQTVPRSRSNLGLPPPQIPSPDLNVHEPA